MGRSLKKGPFVNEKLLKAIDDMNAANDAMDKVSNAAEKVAEKVKEEYNKL